MMNETGQALEWQPGEVVNDRYRIEDVASGSMGKVYIAEHLGWGIRMAIKAPRQEILQDREGLRCILQEANHWIRMGMHPNITSCYYVLTITGVPYLFIEYVDGGSLADWIRAGRCRDFRTTLSLATQFCHGMEYTHRHGVIHRDIKPQNILITKNALLKITDFGIILSMDDGTAGALPMGDASNEGTMGFRGTPGYASPEQFRDSHRIDGRSDIYSFGLCLWLMFCGKKPFARNFYKEAVPDPVAAADSTSLPQNLCELLKKAVAWEPDERFQNFKELRTALNDVYQDLFRIPCPYMEIPHVDMRADGLNNRAVSLFELGKTEEAAQCLATALDLNDTLPEAVYNRILMQLRIGSCHPSRLLRQIDVARQRFPSLSWFGELEELTRKFRDNNAPDAASLPELRLCVAKKSLDVYRDGQTFASVLRNMEDYMTAKRHKLAADILIKSWKNNGFRRESALVRIYEQLFPMGAVDTLEGAIRLLAQRGPAVPAKLLAMLPGTRQLITVTLDGGVVLLDFSGKNKPLPIKKFPVPITALTVNQRGDFVAIGTKDGQVVLWSVETKKFTLAYSIDAEVSALAFHPAGSALAAGGANGSIKVLRPTTGKTESMLAKASGAIRSLAFLGRTNQLISGSDDGAIRFWELGSREHIRMMEAHALPVTSLSMSEDGLRFVSGCADRLVRIWSTRTGFCEGELKAHEEAVTGVLMLPDNRRIVTGSDDGIIRVWEASTGKCTLVLDGRGEGVATLVMGPRPNIFISGCADGTIVIWMLVYRLKLEESEPAKR